MIWDEIVLRILVSGFLLVFLGIYLTRNEPHWIDLVMAEYEDKRRAFWGRLDQYGDGTCHPEGQQ